MSFLKTVKWTGNQIILQEDVANGESLTIDNNDKNMSKILGETMILAGCEVTESVTPGMSVRISEGVASDSLNKVLLHSEEFLNVPIPAASPTQNRRDLIQIRRATEDVEPQNREFKDPTTGDPLPSQTVDTAIEYKTEYEVKPGVPGSSAPTVTTGWIKLCEIEVTAGTGSILNDKIYNVEATKASENNPNWTTELDIIYRNGTIAEMKEKIVDIENEAVYPDGGGYAVNLLPSWADNTGTKIKNTGKSISEVLTNTNNQVPTSGSIYTLLKPAVQVYTTNSTFVPGPQGNFDVILSGSMTALTLDDGGFDGQEVTLFQNATSDIVTYEGPGIFDQKTGNGTPLGQNKIIKLRWYDSRWWYEDAIVYTSATSIGDGTEYKTMYASGKLIHEVYYVGTNFSASAGPTTQPNMFGITAGNVFEWQFQDGISRNALFSSRHNCYFSDSSNEASKHLILDWQTADVPIMYYYKKQNTTPFAVYLSLRMEGIG